MTLHFFEKLGGTFFEISSNLLKALGTDQHGARLHSNLSDLGQKQLSGYFAYEKLL